MGRSGRVVTYGQLNDGSIRLARLLRETGLRPGDHFAVMMENHPRYCEVVWAALRSGFYVTAINSHLTAAEAAFRLFGSIFTPGPIVLERVIERR